MWTWHESRQQANMLLFIPVLVLSNAQAQLNWRAYDDCRSTCNGQFPGKIVVWPTMCWPVWWEYPWLVSEPDPPRLIHGRAYTNRQVKLQLFIAAAFIFNAAKAAIRFMPSFSILPCMTRICCRNSAHQRLRLLKQQPSYLSLHANFVLFVTNYHV